MTLIILATVNAALIVVVLLMRHNLSCALDLQQIAISKIYKRLGHLETQSQALGDKIDANSCKKSGKKLDTTCMAVLDNESEKDEASLIEDLDPWERARWDADNAAYMTLQGKSRKLTPHLRAQLRKMRQQVRENPI